MIVRELMKQLLNFNPDAEIETVLDDGRSTKFSLGWSASDGEGIESRLTTKHVSIHVNDVTDKKE